MIMATTLKDKLNKLPPNRRKKIQHRADELISDAMTLRELRKTLELTQESIANSLHIRQDGVSRIEKRSDLLLSTLSNYVTAMGGNLKLIVEFPDRPSVNLEGLSNLKGSSSKKDLNISPD